MLIRLVYVAGENANQQPGKISSVRVESEADKATLDALGIGGAVAIYRSGNPCIPHCCAITDPFELSAQGVADIFELGTKTVDLATRQICDTPDSARQEQAALLAEEMNNGDL